MKDVIKTKNVERSKELLEKYYTSFSLVMFNLIVVSMPIFYLLINLVIIKNLTLFCQ